MYGAMMNFGNLLAAGVTFGSQYIAGTWAWRLPSLVWTPGFYLHVLRT